MSEVSSLITDINGVQIETSDDETYLLSSDVVVYEKSYYGNGYKILPLSVLLESDNYCLKAYYDKAQTSGGRIRVIMVTEK